MRSIEETLAADTEEELNKAIDSYMNRYPVHGYDTFTKRKYKEKDVWFAIMSRWNSCD